MNTQATETAFRERLTPLVHQGVDRAREQRQDVLVSVTEQCEPIDPIRLFANSEEISTDRWYWEHPDGGLAIASAGVISGTTFPRKIRFSETALNHRKMVERAIISPEPGADAPGPICFGAYSFDPYREPDRGIWQGFQSSFFLVPRVVLLRSAERHLITFNVLAGPNRDPEELIDAATEFRDQVLQILARDPALDDPPPPLDPPGTAAEKETQQYLQTVNTLVDAVQAGDFEWLTAVRRLRITTSELFSVSRMVHRLRTEHPEFRTVAASRHGSTFVGLARDALASVQGDSLTATGSFGSIRRGDTEDLDNALASHLWNDEQAREHHDMMVASRAEALEPLAASDVSTVGPEIWSLDESHVLQTRIQATLRSDATLLQAVNALHPAPGVAGHPFQEAQEFLREHEAFDRGWLAAPFGWFDANGNGEFVAAERAAIVRAPVMEQQWAYLYTSTPVTSSTDPDQHLTGSEIELAPLLAALTE